MNKITFPLKLQMKGPQVGDLQDALQACLDRNALLVNDEKARQKLPVLLQRERVKQTYSKGTSDLVGAFQKERQLRSSGAVDEPTANALNALLSEWGLLGKALVPEVRIVAGVVRREDRLVLRGAQVRAVHSAAGHTIHLGDDTTDAEGRYNIRYESLPGGDTINLRVFVISKDGTVLQTSQVITNPKTLEMIDLMVPVTTVPSEKLRIEGTIVLEHGLPAENLTLRLYRRDFGGNSTLLDTTTTLAGGPLRVCLRPGWSCGKPRYSGRRK